MALAIILPVMAIGAWAISTDKISYVVTHGVSMNPVYYQGDLVIVVKQDSYQIGQITAYHGDGAEVLHRIVGGDAQNGFVLKGDNNESIDTIEPTGDALIGKAVLHVPKGGIWLKPVLSPTGLGMIGFLLTSSAGAAKTRREIARGRRKKKVKAMGSQGGSWATAAAVAKVIMRLPPLLRAAAALVAVTMGAALALGVLGWMKPAVEQRAAKGTGQSAVFSYSAKVPRSAAYDGITVTSPDPIFRKLTDHVDVRVRYSGPPGALDLSTVLSNDVGWHTTIQLAPARRFAGTTYDTSVGLDLDALYDRANAAAAAIGIESSTLTATVKVRVVSIGIPEFTASVPFALALRQFALADGPKSLVSADPASAAAPTIVKRNIGVFGHSIMTASSARSWAVMLLLAAASGATAIFLLGRRRTPLRTRAEIERRYPQLLVPIEPLASPPGKPVVTVDNFPALVRLAERYGQMILTWRRPDADDFVVRDEGITYRYRVPLEEPTLHNIEHIDRPNAAGSHRRKASSQVS